MPKSKLIPVGKTWRPNNKLRWASNARSLCVISSQCKQTVEQTVELPVNSPSIWLLQAIVAPSSRRGTPNICSRLVLLTQLKVNFVINSLAYVRCGYNLKLIILKLISRAYPANLPPNKCHKISLIVSQYWCRQWLGAVIKRAITWTNIDQVLQTRSWTVCWNICSY